MPVEAAERYPHKQVVMNKYLGILIFELRPALDADARAGPLSTRSARWIDPVEPEAREVAVEGGDTDTVLDRDGGDVGVGD